MKKLKFKKKKKNKYIFFLINGLTLFSASYSLLQMENELKKNITLLHDENSLEQVIKVISSMSKDSDFSILLDLFKGNSQRIYYIKFLVLNSNNFLIEHKTNLTHIKKL